MQTAFHRAAPSAAGPSTVASVASRPALCQLQRVASCTFLTACSAQPVTIRRGQQAASHVARSAVSSSLISVLKDELKLEKQGYDVPEDLLQGPPEPFEMSESPGKSAILLRRTFKNEEILIELDLEAQKALSGNSMMDDSYGDVSDSDGSDDEYGEADPVAFTVSILKEEAGAMLVFACESNGSYLAIERMALRREIDAQDELQVPPYTGPDFSELDDTLQQAFTDYLEERGVSASLGGFLAALALDKRSREYILWLQQLKDFVVA